MPLAPPSPGRSCPHLHGLPNPWGRKPPPPAAPGMDLSQALGAHVSFFQIRLGAGCHRTQLPTPHPPPAPTLPVCPDALLCYKPQTETLL